jgi:hypothetical protein
MAAAPPCATRPFGHKMIGRCVLVMHDRTKARADSWHPGQVVDMQSAKGDLVFAIGAAPLFSSGLGEHVGSLPLVANGITSFEFTEVIAPTASLAPRRRSQPRDQQPPLARTPVGTGGLLTSRTPSGCAGLRPRLGDAPHDHVTELAVAYHRHRAAPDLTGCYRRAAPVLFQRVTQCRHAGHMGEPAAEFIRTAPLAPADKERVARERRTDPAAQPLARTHRLPCPGKTRLPPPGSAPDSIGQSPAVPRSGQSWWRLWG